MKPTQSEFDTAVDGWRVLWAKSEPFHHLWKHLIDAAAVSLALRNPLEEYGWTAELTAHTVGLHDVGKAYPTFQRMCDPCRADLEAAGFSLAIDDGVRHERISAVYLRERFVDATEDERLAESIAMAVGAHHGRWNSGGPTSLPAYAKAQKALDSLLAQLLGRPEVPSARPSNLSSFGIRLAGQVVLADWIASNVAFFTDPRLASIRDPEAYFCAACAVAREAVAGLKLRAAPDEGRPRDLVDDPRPIQQVLLDEDIPPGLVLIEAPMGEGKTEAAWILTEKWRASGIHGVYMALPTQATGDAMARRFRSDYVQRLGRRDRVHLVHGMAWIRDDAEPDRPVITDGDNEDGALAAQWFRPTRRAMLAPNGTGTVDQVLLAALNAKFGFLRMYGLDRRVLIVDEVHAYDAYMTAILCRGLEWCASMRIPVVLLSATLSAEQRTKLLKAYNPSAQVADQHSAYPLISHCKSTGESGHLSPCASSPRTVFFEPIPGALGDPSATASLAQNLAANGRCVCVVVNTVRRAQAVYKQLTQLESDEKLLFHARFTAGQRQRIAEAVTDRFGKDVSRRPPRFVLVATQVVEQSLDVDFDEMITEVAPIDLLLQRLGRLHRHRARQYDAELRVLLPDAADLRFGGTERVYDRYILLRTLALIQSGTIVRLPSDFRPLIEAVYGELPIPDGVPLAELEKARLRWLEGIAEMEAAAEPFLFGAPRANLFQPVSNKPVGDDSDDGNGWRARTRLGANDTTCLFVKQRDIAKLKAGKLPMSAVKDLYADALKVPAYVDLNQPQEGYEPAARAEGALRGLMLIPCETQRQWSSVDHRLCYDDYLGLVVERKCQLSRRLTSLPKIGSRQRA